MDDACVFRTHTLVTVPVRPCVVPRRQSPRCFQIASSAHQRVSSVDRLKHAMKRLYQKDDTHVTKDVTGVQSPFRWNSTSQGFDAFGQHERCIAHRPFDLRIVIAHYPQAYAGGLWARFPSVCVTVVAGMPQSVCFCRPPGGLRGRGGRQPHCCRDVRVPRQQSNASSSKEGVRGVI